MSHEQEPDKFIDEIRARQRNIVFPDTVRNERPLFDFFWNGAHDPPMVQRIGARLFGLISVFSGLVIAALSMRSDGEWLGLAISLITVGVGIRIFRNGFPRHGKPTS